MGDEEKATPAKPKKQPALRFNAAEHVREARRKLHMGQVRILEPGEGYAVWRLALRVWAKDS